MVFIAAKLEGTKCTRDEKPCIQSVHDITIFCTVVGVKIKGTACGLNKVLYSQKLSWDKIFAKPSYVCTVVIFEG